MLDYRMSVALSPAAIFEPLDQNTLAENTSKEKPSNFCEQRDDINVPEVRGFVSEPVHAPYVNPLSHSA